MQQVEQDSQFWLGAPVAPVPKRTSVSRSADKIARLSSPLRNRFKGARLRVVCVAAALAGALIYTVVTDGGRNTRASDPLLPNIETAVAAIGFGVDQITITGQKYTSDADIYEALDLDNTRSFATLDADDARKRIEELPWVEKAELTRAYPGGLDVKVVERKPWAVWRKGSRDLLIDESGRVLAEVKAGSAGTGLLHLSGEGAAKDAPALMSILTRYPDIARELQEAERIAERRWTLKLQQNTVLILPPEREAQALSMYTSDRTVKALTADGGFTIDLRAVNKITVRKTGGSAPPAGASPPASEAKS